MASINYAEATGDFSPSEGGFSLQGGRARMIWQVAEADVNAAITDLLGAVIANGDGRLTRFLPKVHPLWPWLMCSTIGNIQGFGTYSKGTPLVEPSVIDNTNLFANVATYPYYNLTCEFAPRPYPVVPDSKIKMVLDNWYNDSGLSVYYKYATEYLRFVDYEFFPDASAVTAQRGQMKFRTGDNAAPGAASGGGHTFAAAPRLYLGTTNLVIHWTNVPYTYITSSNSYLEKYKGRVNQSAFLGWSAAQILYLNYRVKRYTPPVPSGAVEQGSSGIFAPVLNCDIDLLCQVTRRTQTNVPAPANANFIAAGHNLQPWLQTRQFYYASTSSSSDTDNTSGTPVWRSFPFPILFTDPDYSQANV